MNGTNAGPMLDADIARILWKSLVVHDAELGESYLMGEDWQKVPLPKFSTDIDDAHRVVAHLQSMGWTVHVKNKIDRGTSTYQVVFFKLDNRHYIATEHEMLPTALCLAALGAISGLNVKKV